MLFVIKKLITPFLFPPGILIIFLLLGAVWLARRRNRKEAIAAVTAAVLLWVSSAAPVANMLVTGLEKGLEIPRLLHGDVIVLLGGGVFDEVRDLTGRGAPSDEMMARIVTAVRAQRALNLPIIVSAGAVLPNRAAEAHVVKRFLLDLGIPKDMVIVEDKSRDTAENADFTSAICTNRGLRMPILVTSALHMRRAVAGFAGRNLEVVPLPVNLELRDGEEFWTDFLPRASSLERTSYVFHEYLGLLFYRLTR